MKNKDFFKEVLSDEMPDLEVVRQKCLTADTKKKKSVIITVLKSDLLLKRILPLTACIAITAVTVAAFYTKDTPEKFITPNSQFSGEDFNGKRPTEKTTKKKDNKSSSNNSGNNKSKATVTKSAETVTEQTQTQSITENKLLIKPNASKNYVSFNSFDELKSFASSLSYEEDSVIVNSESVFILKIPYTELSMFFEDKKIYYFSINGENLCNNGVIEKYISDGFTGCSFSVSHGGNQYELGYSTYKCSKDITADEEFTGANGYKIKMSGGNYFSMNINGYHFYVKALSDDAQAAKEFVNNLSVSTTAIE